MSIIPHESTPQRSEDGRNKKLQEFEQNLLQLIQNPPQPKYQQWQQVSQGRIVGVYFVSVGVAYHDEDEDVDPGWYYVVESGFNHSMLAESQVKPILNESGIDELDEAIRADTYRP